MSNPNILQAALTRLDDAARHVQIDGDVLEKLKYPRETTKVRLRTAAYIHALGRLAGAIEAHGTQQFFTS